MKIVDKMIIKYCFDFCLDPRPQKDTSSTSPLKSQGEAVFDTQGFVQTDAGSVCRQPLSLDVFSCPKRTRRYMYDATKRKCVRFWGCRKPGNNFDKRRTCKNTCIKPYKGNYTDCFPFFPFKKLQQQSLNLYNSTDLAVCVCSRKNKTLRFPNDLPTANFQNSYQERRMSADYVKLNSQNLFSFSWAILKKIGCPSTNSNVIFSDEDDNVQS